MDIGVAETMALNFGAYGLQAIGPYCWSDRNLASSRLTEASKRWFGQAEIAGADQGIVVGD